MFTAKSKATIAYVYKDKLTYSRKKALHVKHDKMQIVFHNTRTDYTRKLKDVKRWDSLIRTRSAIYEIADCNVGEHGNMPIFVTFTFAENIKNVREANVLWRSFLRRFKRRYKFAPKYITVVEFQKRGAVHYHSLFFNLPFTPVREFEEVWGHGYTNIKALHTIRNVSAYLCKYLTKETSDSRLYGEKVYFCSRGLLRPVVTRDSIEVNAILHGYNVTEEKHLSKKKLIKYKSL